MSRDWLLLLLEPTGEEQMFQMGYFWAGLVTQPTVYPAHRDLCATLCRGACPSVYTYWCGLINIDTQEVSGSWTLLGGLGPRRGGPAHSSAAQRRGWVGVGVGGGSVSEGESTPSESWQPGRVMGSGVESESRTSTLWELTPWQKRG